MFWMTREVVSTYKPTMAAPEEVYWERWVRGAIWVAGSCVVWCPVCVCLSGGGAWWVCACAVGLITITLGSGYTSWTVFNNLLKHGPQSYPLFTRVFSIVERIVERGHVNSSILQDKGRPSTTSGVGGSSRTGLTGTQDIVMQEVVLSATSLHNFLVMPWYRLVSPDNHFSYQIKDILEEMLTNMCQKVRESASITHLASGLIHIYLQHYRQYHRALRKVSKKHRDGEPLSQQALQELQARYKSSHPALKSPETLQMYYRKLAQIILHHYLPVEVTRCDLVLLSLRDLFAQNVLQAFVDLLCDTQWLNTMLAEILSGITDEEMDGRGNSEVMETDTSHSKDSLSSDTTGILQGADRDKVPGYTKLLASIKEETLSDLQECEPVSPQPAERKEIESKPVIKCHSFDGVYGEREKFENAEALVEYVRSSSLEKKDSREEDEYKTVSSALGTLISTTAGPLLPDSTSPLSYQPLVTKMWESPVEDRCFIEAPAMKKKKNPFSRNVVEGMKEEDYKLMYNPRIGDKLSVDSLTSLDQDCTVASSLEGEVSGLIEIRVEDSECLESDSVLSAVPPNLCDMPRSKSCGSLMNKAKETCGTGDEAKRFHGSLNELDKSGNSDIYENSSKDDSFVGNEEELGNRKEKGHLVKMLSFDKNDGTDEASLQSKLSTEEGSYVVKTLTSEVANSDGSVHSSNTTLDFESKDDAEPPNTLEIPSSPPINDAGFGWENPDLSPIYEESEDLASSIAKLRSLLTERESQHSLGSLSSHGSSESEPKSAQSDPGRYSLEKSRFTFTHKDSSGSLDRILAASVKSVSSLESCGNGIADEDLMEAAEIPLDGRVFLSVTVPSTEVHSELGGAQYTLYTIQYDAIYLCESAPPPPESEEEVATEPVVVPEPRMILQTNCVKRRFREFLTLHSALEDDQKLRSAMKGVKGPNKWLNLPFSKLDSTTIATRKQFLEKYLQSVIQRPELNISTPVKEFLAYGLDSSVSFVKKPLELHVPRLDKLLAKTVSGVFHSIKTALPSFESSDNPVSGGEAVTHSVSSGSSTGGDVVRNRSSSGVLGERSKLAAFLSSGTKTEYELKLDITAEEEECQIEEALTFELSGIGSKSELVDTAYEARESRSMFLPQLSSLQQCHQFEQEQQVHQHSVVVGRGDVGMGSGSHSSYPYPAASPFHHLPPPGPRSQGDGCDISTLSQQDSHEDSITEGEEDISWKEWPLSVGLLEMIVEIFGSADHPLTHQPCVTLLTLTMARITHKWLQAELERLFCDTCTVEYIQHLRDSVLVRSSRVPTPPPSQEDITRSRIKLEEALKQFIPGVVHVMTGEEVMRHAIMRMVSAIQHPAITIDLVLHILDLIVIQLLPITPLTP
ncbi:uncharacterized protein LOC135220521 [Macrobrachium nipponense]|uniref:uncharacterized protein LOC135220521 n=1 Tax=Macrobrachium nipponense TaxID=159736 RepID=UPI0030C8055B